MSTTIEITKIYPRTRFSTYLFFLWNKKKISPHPHPPNTHTIFVLWQPLAGFILDRCWVSGFVVPFYSQFHQIPSRKQIFRGFCSSNIHFALGRWWPFFFFFFGPVCIQSKYSDTPTTTPPFFHTSSPFFSTWQPQWNPGICTEGIEIWMFSNTLKSFLSPWE